MSFESPKHLESAVRTEEMDVQRNHQLFRELPSKSIQLFAVHLARPLEFVKILTTGQIATSVEIDKQLPKKYARTHRGDILNRNPALEGDTTNEYISFSVGLPKLEYSTTGRTSVDGVAGLGFISPIEDFMARPGCSQDAEVQGDLYSNLGLEAFKRSNTDEPELAEAVTFLEQNPFVKYINKDILVPAMNVVRKNGTLTANNAPEIHLWENEEGLYPRVPLSELLTLFPESKRVLLIRVIEQQLKKMEAIAPKLQELFGIDVTKLTAEAVLEDKAIYWYPQETITEAVEYLSTHKKKYQELFIKK